MAVSLAKVADVDRNLDEEDTATQGFQEAINLLESLKISSEENALEQRVRNLESIITYNNSCRRQS